MLNNKIQTKQNKIQKIYKNYQNDNNPCENPQIQKLFINFFLKQKK